MGVVYQRQKFSDFSSEISLRNDFKFINSLSKEDKSFYKFKEIFDFVEYKSTKLDELDEFLYSEIGDVTKNGEVNPILLSFSDRNEENESLFKKIEKGDIIKPLKGDILISKIRPYLNKNVLIGDEEIYYTKAFIHIRPKINSEIFYFAIRTIFFEQLNAVSRQGKGYPTLKEDDIKSIKFSKHIIDTFIKKENEILLKTNPLNLEITKLKNSKLKPLDIINKVFGEEFKIDLSILKILDETRKLNVKFSNLYADNSNLRSGIRWSKMQFIQKELYKNIDCIKTLGYYISKSNNGWSPLSVENGEGTPILGQESFSFDGILNVEPSKFTEQTKKNINDFYINQGDFFVSRGNTVDLVALACVVENEIAEDILYPDLFIKVAFDEKIINKKYLAFVFNSFIGRLYFKYVAKGKNQTMVKISSIELENFHFPLPNIEKQAEIVEKIKSQIDAQNIIDNQIELKQQQINEIIENAIKTE
jgi:type I restriction enzyme S subunit